MRQAWQEFADASASWYQLYQSPIWWDHLNALGSGELRLAAVLDGTGQPVAMAPLRLTNRLVALGGIQRRWFSRSFRCWEILGGEPLVAPGSDEWALPSLISGIANQVGRTGLYAKTVDLQGGFGKWIARADRAAALSAPVMEHGPRKLFGVQLAGPFADFERLFSHKQRYNLRRQFRKLADDCGGELTAKRFTEPDEVPALHRSIATLAATAPRWNQTDSPNLTALSDASARGLLRAYCLLSGDRALAYAIGYQNSRVFHYSDIGFDLEFSRHSPGIVLLWEMLKDLFAFRAPEYLNFGVGDASYKRRFSNCEKDDASVFFAPNTLGHRVWWSSHRLLRRCRALLLRYK